MMKMLILISLVSIVLIAHTNGLRCSPCRDRICKPQSVLKRECRGGIVKDYCGCCNLCAKQYGESCGGRLGMHGRCDQGLYCKLVGYGCFVFPFDYTGYCARSYFYVKVGLLRNNYETIILTKRPTGWVICGVALILEWRISFATNVAYLRTSHKIYDWLGNMLGRWMCSKN